jgi:hypothetical protein
MDILRKSDQSPLAPMEKPWLVAAPIKQSIYGILTLDKFAAIYPGTAVG